MYVDYNYTYYLLLSNYLTTYLLILNYIYLIEVLFLYLTFYFICSQLFFILNNFFYRQSLYIMVTVLYFLNLLIPNTLCIWFEKSPVSRRKFWVRAETWNFSPRLEEIVYKVSQNSNSLIIFTRVWDEVGISVTYQMTLFCFFGFLNHRE